MFSYDELRELSAIVLRHPRCLVISDEVYEHLVYDNKQHISPASLPGMWDRTITVSSAGKTYSCTGWKIGWAVGPAKYMQPLASVNQWVPFCVSTPAQVY